jgi:radical SAM superfamily enzyme YgiQ (UPF0313 family)
MSPWEDIEEDIEEVVQMLQRHKGQSIKRTFLTGANPFVLSFERLMKISELIKQNIPSCETIGSFARVTDITLKSDEELEALHKAGYNGLTIGIETGDDEALRFMNKGYQSADIIEQCKRLDKVGIQYYFFYLTGISGAGRGEIGAKATAEICNQLNPLLIGPNMMTVYPDSELYEEIQKGNWKEEGELEKYREIKVLAENLTIPTTFAAMGASNAFNLQCKLPQDRDQLLSTLDRIIDSVSEEELRQYRDHLPHL